MVSKTQNILKKEEVQEAGSILRICNSVDDSFFTKVIQISKRILLETKRLTNTINEDEIIEAAKSTALCTFELVDLVKNHLSNVAQDQLTIGDRFMIESSNKLRTNILKFIDAVRSNQANPYDYLAKQEVEVASKEVVAAIKQVLTAAEAYEGEGEDGEQEEEEIPQPQQTQSSTTPYDIAEDVKKAKTLLQNVINAVLNRNESQFGGFCKEFILQVNQLISISSKLQTNMEEPLKQATFSLVNAAKVAIGNPSDKVLIKQLDKAKQEMNDAIKSFLFACNKQSRLRRSSWKMVMESDEPVSEEDKVKKDVALRLIGILGDHFRTFKADWQGMKPELQDIVLKRMIEEFKPLGEGIKSSAENSSINEENEAMRELKRIMTMSNSNDLMAISKELKTFTKKIDKQVKQTTIGSNIMKTMSATQAVEKNLTELLIMCSDSVGDEHDRMLTTSVSNFLDALGTILSQTKLAAGIVTRRKSALKNRGTTPTLPESGDDKIRALLDTALQEVIATVNNFPKGKPEQNVISFITEGQNAAVDNYLSIKMKVEETIWSLIEDDTLSFKNTLTQLITTVASMLGNDVKRKDLKVILQLASLSKSIVSVISTILTSVSTYHYLKTTKSLLVAQQSSTKLLEMASPKGRNRTGSVWDDKSQGVFSQSNEYLGGSLDQIIRHVTTIQDTNFVKSFIMTYQSFTSAWVVLDKLMQRYEGPPTKIDDTELLKIKLRVCVVLKYWIENQFHDFDDNLIKKLMTFIMDTIRHDPQTQMAEMAKRLQSEMMKRIDEKNKEKKSLFETTPTIKTPDSGNSPAEMFMSFGDLEIAKQLTLRDFKVYAKVQPSELLNQAWTSPKLKHRSPNVISLISRTNKLSFGIASLILWNTTILDRAKCIEKMIKIAQFLREMNNFNTLLSIIAGLNTSAISRLKSTWEAVPKPLRDSLAKLQNIFDPSNSYKNYRAGRNEATSKGPTMPYIGTTLSDLTFAEDGNPDCLQDNTTLINFSKRELICKIIMDFLHNQHPPYNIATSEPIFTFVEELPSLEEKVLYELSLVREPRVQQQTK